MAEIYLISDSKNRGTGEDRVIATDDYLTHKTLYQILETELSQTHRSARLLVFANGRSEDLCEYLHDLGFRYFNFALYPDSGVVKEVTNYQPDVVLVDEKGVDAKHVIEQIRRAELEKV